MSIFQNPLRQWTQIGFWELKLCLAGCNLSPPKSSYVKTLTTIRWLILTRASVCYLKIHICISLFCKSSPDHCYLQVLKQVISTVRMLCHIQAMFPEMIGLNVLWSVSYYLHADGFFYPDVVKYKKMCRKAKYKEYKVHWHVHFKIVEGMFMHTLELASTIILLERVTQCPFILSPLYQV